MAQPALRDDFPLRERLGHVMHQGLSLKHSSCFQMLDTPKSRDYAPASSHWSVHCTEMITCYHIPFNAMVAR